MSADKKKTALNGGAIESGMREEIQADQIPRTKDNTAPAGVSIVRFLRSGSGEAIHGEELARLAGVGSTRALRRIIEAERAAGAAILSGPGGYFLPAAGTEGQAEIRRYLAALRRKAASILAGGIPLEVKLMEMEQRSDSGGCDMCG